MHGTGELDGFEIDTSANRRAWPFYIVFDVSESMWGPSWDGRRSPHTVMGDSLGLILDSLAENPAARAVGWLEVITFAERAQTHYPLSPIKEQRRMPPLPRGEWTNYVDVWELLNTSVPAAVRSLKNQGYRLMQPVVFFITDGIAGSPQNPQPVSSWKPLHDSLCDAAFHERPLIVSLGMGTVNEETLLAIRSVDPIGPACIADPGEPASTLLDGIINVIITSISHSTGTGAFGFDVPRGMRRIDDT